MSSGHIGSFEVQQMGTIHARSALIIGGDHAGSTAAMALEKAGIESAVYEAHVGSAKSMTTMSQRTGVPTIRFDATLYTIDKWTVCACLRKRVGNCRRAGRWQQKERSMAMGSDELGCALVAVKRWGRECPRR
jgi:hypothetical protein